MSDEFGAIEFPVAPVHEDKDAVTDPGLSKLAKFLKAVLNSELNSAWAVVNPGKPFVNEVSTNDPGDGTFNVRSLPGLFVTRASSRDEQTSDDWTETITDVRCLWVPQDAVQAKRALRSPGTNGLQKVITRALRLGRRREWFDPGDDDPQARELGSVLITRMGLLRWPFVVSVKPEPLIIEMDQARASYPGVSMVIRISEMTDWDPADGGIPSKLALNVNQTDVLTEQVGFTNEILVPTS